MRPDPQARPEFVAAFRELAARIERVLSNSPKKILPIKMYVAGGTALHFYTGASVSEDVDAVFSRRIVLPENLEVVYRDADGTARLLYFDRQYNDTLGLLHEDANDSSVLLSLEGLNPKVLEVRLLSPIDLAISKLGRFAEHDRDDIMALAKHGLLKVRSFRKRALEAAVAYVGDVARVQGLIEIACRLIEKEVGRRRTVARRTLAKKKK